MVDYHPAGGPATDAQQDMRFAVDATAQDVQLGRKLFFGEARLAGGAVACVFCHQLSKQTRLGGTLPSDLSGAYTRHLDWALDQKLKRPCVSGATDLNTARVVEAESLALRAFLRSLSTDFIPTLINDQRSVGIRTPSSR